MTEITALVRTQKIVVNPSSRSVSVVSAGPQGPPGAGGGLSEEEVVDAVGASVIGANNIGVSYDGSEITVEDIPDMIVHDWVKDGWTPFTEQLINDDTTGSPTTQTTSVVNGKGRITNSGTQGNLRKAYLRAGTQWMDSEVRSLMYGADVFSTTGTNPATPQGGHVHRAYTDGSGIWRAIVVTNNIFATDVNVINGNVWNRDASFSPPNELRLGSNGGAKTYGDAELRRRPRIVGVNRFVFGISINKYYVTPGHAYGLEVGTPCVVDVVLDNTFDIATAQAISAVNPGEIQFTDAESGAAVTDKFDSGTIDPTQASARRWWPYWVASRVVGSKLTTKVWRQFDPEPDWGDTRYAATYDFAAAQAPAPNALYPDQPGLCGVVGCHLRNTRYFEYGQWSAKKLG